MYTLAPKGERARKNAMVALRDKFIKDENNRGYILSNVKVTMEKVNAVTKDGIPYLSYERAGIPQTILLVIAHAGYAGKRQAKLIREVTTNNVLLKRPTA